MFRTQGPVFWGAAAAVALGATLLLMTVYAFLRQTIGRRGGRPRLRKRRASAAPAAALTVDETGYRFAGGNAGPAVRPPAGPTLDPDRLWARLRAAGDRLEACRDGMGPQGAAAWESPLKAGPPAVEYVFRKGIG